MIKKLISVVLTAVLLCMAIPSASAVTVTDTIWDINFDNGDLSGSTSEKPGFGVTHASGSTAEYVVEPIRSNKALKLTVPAGKSIRYGSESFTYDFTGKVQWYEMSMRFEENFSLVTLTISTASTFKTYIEIDANGALKVTGNATNITLEKNKWYHFVVAVDFIYDWNGTTPLYTIWINGERFALGTAAPWNTYTHTSHASLADMKPSADAAGNTKNSTFRMFFNNTSANNSVCYIDNIKLYTSSVRLMDIMQNPDFESEKYNPLSIFDGAVITSEILKVDEAAKTITVPAGETFGGLSTALKGTAAFTKADGTLITSENDVLTEASAGDKVHVPSPANAGVAVYNIAIGPRLFDYRPSSVAWQRKGVSDESFSALTTLSAVTAKDEVKLSLTFDNSTSSPESGLLVLAAYNGAKLAGYSFTPLTDIENGDTITSNPIAIKDTSDIKIRGYIWKGTGDFTPIMTGLELPQ